LTGYSNPGEVALGAPKAKSEILGTSEGVAEERKVSVSIHKLLRVGEKEAPELR